MRARCSTTAGCACTMRTCRAGRSPSRSASLALWSTQLAASLSVEWRLSTACHSVVRNARLRVCMHSSSAAMRLLLCGVRPCAARAPPADNRCSSHGRLPVAHRGDRAPSARGAFFAHGRLLAAAPARAAKGHDTALRRALAASASSARSDTAPTAGAGAFASGGGQTPCRYTCAAARPCGIRVAHGCSELGSSRGHQRHGRLCGRRRRLACGRRA